MFVFGDQADSSDQDLRVRLGKIYDKYFETCTIDSPENNKINLLVNTMNEIFSDLNLEKLFFAFILTILIYKLLVLTKRLICTLLCCILTACSWLKSALSKIVLTTFTKKASCVDSQIQTTIEETIPIIKEIYINFKNDGDNKTGSKKESNL
jgi:hypothetical protein